jgi:hypothetical protein
MSLEIMSLQQKIQAGKIKAETKKFSENVIRETMLKRRKAHEVNVALYNVEWNNKYRRDAYSGVSTFEYSTYIYNRQMTKSGLEMLL